MKMRRSLILVALCFTPQRLHAFNVDADLAHWNDLGRTSEFICHARVVSVTSQREQYDPQINMVMSRVKLRVMDNWKGQLPREVEIRSFGGVLDGIPYFAVEFPRFKVGEEVVLFLKNFQGGLFPVKHSLGKETVKEGKIERTGMSLRDFHDVLLRNLE